MSPTVPELQGSQRFSCLSEFIGDLGINALYHFTDERNHDMVKKHGLMSWKQLQCKELTGKVKPGGCAQSRATDKNKGLDDFVHLSFCQRHPMAFVATKEGRINNAVVFRIKPGVVDLPGVMFCDRNAARADGRVQGGFEGLAKVRVKIMHGDYQSLSPEERTLYQAEVLVPQHVPAQLVESSFSLQDPREASGAGGWKGSQSS